MGESKNETMEQPRFSEEMETNKKTAIKDTYCIGVSKLKKSTAIKNEER